MIFFISLFLGIMAGIYILRPKIYGPNSRELKNYIVYSKSLDKYFKFFPKAL